MSNFQKNSTALLLVFSILAVLALMVPVTACAAGGERDRNYSQDPGPRAGDSRSIEGQWLMNNANEPGKLEFFREGHRWTGRIWIDAFSRWEELADIFFDPRTGEVRFSRPTYGAPYSGILSGNQIAGTFIYQGNTYSWEARRH